MGNYGSANSINPHMSSDDWDYDLYDRTTYRTYDLYSRNDKRRHEFVPILLIISHVYNCKHCGAKKEECSSDYCNDTEDYDIGGWG